MAKRRTPQKDNNIKSTEYTRYN